MDKDRLEEIVDRLINTYNTLKERRNELIVRKVSRVDLCIIDASVTELEACVDELTDVLYEC